MTIHSNAAFGDSGLVETTTAKRAPGNSSLGCVAAMLILLAGCTSESTRIAIETQRLATGVQDTIFGHQNEGLRVLLFRDLVNRLDASMAQSAIEGAQTASDAAARSVAAADRDEVESPLAGARPGAASPIDLDKPQVSPTLTAEIPIRVVPGEDVEDGQRANDAANKLSTSKRSAAAKSLGDSPQLVANEAARAAGEAAALISRLSDEQKRILNEIWNERDLVEFWHVQYERSKALRAIGVDAKLVADQSVVDLLIKSLEARADRIQQHVANQVVSQAAKSAGGAQVEDSSEAETP